MSVITLSREDQDEFFNVISDVMHICIEYCNNEGIHSMSSTLSSLRTVITAMDASVVMDLFISNTILRWNDITSDQGVIDTIKGIITNEGVTDILDRIYNEEVLSSNRNSNVDAIRDMICYCIELCCDAITACNLYAKYNVTEQYITNVKQLIEDMLCTQSSDISSDEGSNNS